MKKRFLSAVLLTILLVTFGFGNSPTPAAASASLPAPLVDGAGAAFVPGQLIVGLASSPSLGSVAGRAEALAQAVGAKVLKTDGQGVLLLDVGPMRNLEALVLTVKRIKGVRYAEPNYIYKAPAANTGRGLIPPSNSTPVAQPVQAAAPATVTTLPYPDDPGLSTNYAWFRVEADIVWKNTTPSKGVCVISTGVDYNHKDLVGRVIKGYNFANNNADPMDDNGRGTHLAGIIAANSNNGEGMAGVSTGKVVAVKVLDSAGNGTAYDISQGIKYCADDKDASILDVDSAGAASQTLQDAIAYAASNKGKLVVAPAGDNGSGNSGSIYPAAYSSTYPEVVAVAASGASGIPPDTTCRAPYSDFGGWISLVAPGTGIYSTTPWDRPFYLNQNNTHPRYDSMYGTEQAAAFVSAAAARTWGYMTTSTASGIAQRLKDTGTPISPASANGTCWPVNMAGFKNVNLAGAMDRGAVILNARDAVTRNPLTGATVSLYAGSSSTLAGSAVLPVAFYFPIGSQTYAFPDFVILLNVPSSGSTVYTAKVSATNYTASSQNAFVGPKSTANADGTFIVTPGTYVSPGIAYVPPKSANFTVIGQSGNAMPWPAYMPVSVWLPNNLPSVPHFILSWYLGGLNDQVAWAAVLPWGSLLEPPYGRVFFYDAFYQSIVIQNRKTDTAAPWYQGAYVVGITDAKNVGDPNLLDNNNVSVLVWKDGVIKIRVDKGSLTCTNTDHYWFPLSINSPASGAATYIPNTTKPCGLFTDRPY